MNSDLILRFKARYLVDLYGIASIALESRTTSVRLRGFIDGHNGVPDTVAKRIVKIFEEEAVQRTMDEIMKDQHGA